MPLPSTCLLILAMPLIFLLVPHNTKSRKSSANTITNYLSITLTMLATPIQTDNSCAEGIVNDTVKQRRSKAIDMRFYWVRDRVRQGQFKIYWKRGKDQYADYFTKHFPASHHREMRPMYLHVEQANSLIESTMLAHCEGVLIQLDPETNDQQY